MSLRGTLKAVPGHMALEASDGKLTCSGSYNGLMGASVVVNVTCNDGRKGVAVIENKESRTEGHLHLEDGTNAEIVTNVAG